MRRRILSKKILPLLSAAVLAASAFTGVSAAAQGGITILPDASSNVFEDVTEEFIDETIDLTLQGEEALSDDNALVSEAEESAVAPDEETRVIIVFEDDAVVDAGFTADDITDNDAALALSEDIVSEQETIVSEIEDALDGEELQVHYNFSILTNALSADVRYEDIETIRQVDGVSAVFVATQHEPLSAANPNMVTAGDMVGSTTTWLSGYTGAGQRIAIIDTGIDDDHPSFDGGAFLAHLAETAKENEQNISDYALLDVAEIETVLPYLNASAMMQGVTAADLSMTEKIPFAFNYVDGDLDVTHDNDSQGDHGTHVAGISTANTFVPDASSDTGYSVQSAGVMGVAPDAQLLVMKVFGKGGGAYTDDYMAAIEDAILLKADAINLSLGSSSAGFSSETSDYVSSVIDKMTASNSVVTISAGNSGRWSDESTYGANLKEDVNLDTVGSPGSYTNAFTVASAVNSGYTGYTVLANGEVLSFYNDGSNTDAPAFRTLDTSADGNGTEYDFVLINGFGETADYEGVDVEGRIAVVQRGSITFADKHMNAAAAGAAGLLVFNNTSGTISMTMQGSDALIPVASITLADGESMMATSVQDEENESVYYGKLIVTNGVRTNYNAPDGYTISNFSSMGVPDSLELKPEISAPGGNIYSTLDGGSYGIMSGTSMSAPSTAGISALVIQYIKENDLAAKTGMSVRALAQSLIMSTASPMHVDNKEEEPEISPRSQGAGLANAADATTSPAYILVGDKEGNDGKVKIELGDDAEKKGVYTFSFDVYNLTDEALLYDVEAAFTTEEIVYDDYIWGEPHKLNPGISVRTSNTVYVYDLNGDRYFNAKDAKVLLQHVNGSKISQRVLQMQDEFDFNNDGVVDTADVTWLMNEFRVKRSDKNILDARMAVTDKTTVTVTAKLTEEDRAYLDQFENGMYVDGYVYLTGGGVELSVPVLAFYGNWADSSMYEPFDYLESANNADYDGQTYTGLLRTNNLTISFAGDTARYYYNGNMYATDDAYIPDRNAISSVSGDSIASINFSLIRNAGRYATYVQDAESGEYYVKNLGNRAYAAYYSSSQNAWMNTSFNVGLNWKGADAAGQALAEGTKVNIGVRAVPSYFSSVDDIFDVQGRGLDFSVPMTIDNTAPEVLDMQFDEENHLATVTLHDNRYTGAVLMLNAERNEILGRYAVNQTEADVDMDLTFEYPDELFFLYVYDYANNLRIYRVNKSDHPDTTVPETLAVLPERLTVLKNSEAKISAKVGPIYLLDEYAGVTYESADTQIATVSADGIVTGVEKGETDIYVSTIENGPDGVPLTSTCHVTVDTVDIDLNAFQWDENGQVFFSEFNVMDPKGIRKVSERMSDYYMSATNYKDGKYIAATDEEGDESRLIVVDPADSYSTVELPERAIAPLTDLAYSEAFNQLYASYAYYVILMDPDTGEYQGLMNLQKALSGEYIASMCLVSSETVFGMNFDYLGIMTTSGSMYWLMFSWDYGYETIYFGETGIDTNGQWQYNSLYYDFYEDYYFWSVYDNTNVQTLYAVKDETVNGEEVVSAFRLGEFPEAVWPVGGLNGVWKGVPEGGWENWDFGDSVSPVKGAAEIIANTAGQQITTEKIGLIGR